MSEIDCDWFKPLKIIRELGSERVFLQTRPASHVTSAGLYLTNKHVDEKKYAAVFGRVITIGSDCERLLGINLNFGDFVMVSRFVGFDIKADVNCRVNSDYLYKIVDLKDVLGVFDENELVEQKIIEELEYDAGRDCYRAKSRI